MNKPSEKTGAAAPRAREDGQSLVVIILLGAVLAFFGAFLTRMLLQEAKQTVATKKRDKAFTAGDAALQRSMSVLLESSGNWDNADSLTGYSSLTATTYAYTDIPGLTYYIKIKKGTLEDPGNTTGAADDSKVDAWTNVGSLDRDRTIFVRTVDDVTGHEDRFYTVVHRTPKPPYVYGGDAIYAEGSITLGNNWTGHVYNSCLGPYGGSGALDNSEGSITVGGSVPPDEVSEFDSGGNWGGYNYSPGTTANAQPLVVPSTIAIPGYSKTSSISANITLNNPTDGTTIAYECYSLNLTSKTLTVNGPGKIQLWITGPTGGKRFILGGSGDVQVNANGSSECCQSKLFTVYMTAEDATTSDVSIEWHGCPTGNFLLVAPKANMDFRGGGSNTFQGALVVQNLIIAPNSNADFYYDACLKQSSPVDNYAAPPLITTRWRQIGLDGQTP